MFTNTALKNPIAIILLIVLYLITGCVEPENEKMTRELNEFIAEYEKKIIPLQEKYNLASFLASTTGNEGEYKIATELSIAISRVYANKESYQTLKGIKESKLITDTLLARQLDILYNLFIPYQLDEEKLVEIITLENEIKREYSAFRPLINEEQVSDNKIEEILKTSTDSIELEKYWRASKKIGRLVDDDLKKLVKLRNEAAQTLNFKNYHEMMLIVNGQDPKEIEYIFDELDSLSKEGYNKVKAEIDSAMAYRFNLATWQLKPWHYQNRYFQKAPAIFDIDFDKYYQDKNFVSLVGNYYSGIGIEVTKIYETSDLFEKPGKSQLAFSTDINRNGDVRMSANIVNTQEYMSTFLAETAFAAYLKNIDKELPYTLRQAPQFAAIDGIASLFGNMAVNPGWLEKIIGLSVEEKEKISRDAIKKLRIEKFVFSRWAQVMYRFEKALYENPDQNLNALWWELVEKYQQVKKPGIERDEPDWATKTHIVTMPCNYHNFMLGELVASQIYSYINKNILKENEGCETKCINNPEIGKYMIEKLFKPGARYNMNDWLINATGEELSPEYFVNQYIKLE